MARDTSGGAVEAFLQRRKKRAGGKRYESDGKTLYVWGNKVAQWTDGKIRVCDAGYRTLLTKNTINAIIRGANVPCQVYQERHQWMVGCAPRGYDQPRRNVKWPGCVTVRPR